MNDEAIWKPSSEVQNSFWIKSRTGEDMGQFSTGPINKAVPSFTSSLFDKSTWTVMDDILSFFSTQEKLLLLMVFVLSWIVETISDNTSTAKLSLLKAV